MKNAIILTAVALLGAVAPAAAQLSFSTRAQTMGGAYLGLARGMDALYLNPANLGLSNTPYWSVAFPQLALGSTVLGPAYGDLKDARNFDDIPQERKDEILAMIPESGTEIRWDVASPIFAISTGRFALGVAYGVTGEHSLGKDLVDLIFNEYQSGRTDYSVERTEGSRASYLDVAAGYGRKIGPISLGVTGHYYHGFTLMRSRLFEPRFDLATQDFEIDYVGVFSAGGQGYGVDLGVSVEPIPQVTLSGVVANALTSMTWDENLHWSDTRITRSSLQSSSSLLRVLDTFMEAQRDLDPSAVPLEVAETARGLFKEAYFPTTLRLGAAYAPLAATDIAAAYQEKLTPGRLGGRWDRVASVGIQHQLSGGEGRGLYVRAGYMTNLGDAQGISGGVSLGPLHLGFTKLSDGMFEGEERTGWTATFGLGGQSNLMP